MELSYETVRDILERWQNEGIVTDYCSAVDLVEAGYERHNGRYESGFHPHQTDDPKVILTEIRAAQGDDVEVVFLLDATGQFDVEFSAYYRSPDES